MKDSIFIWFRPHSMQCFWKVSIFDQSVFISPFGLINRRLRFWHLQSLTAFLCAIFTAKLNRNYNFLRVPIAVYTSHSMHFLYFLQQLNELNGSSLEGILLKCAAKSVCVHLSSGSWTRISNYRKIFDWELISARWLHMTGNHSSQQL